MTSDEIIDLRSWKVKEPNRSTYHTTTYELFSYMNTQKRLIKPQDLITNSQEKQVEEECIKDNMEI